MLKKIVGPALCLAIVITLIPADAALATSPTTSITIIKYDTDRTTILDEQTVTWEWMKDNLPVQGDGVTHYYHQGPSFDSENLWDPDETISVDSRDFGAVLGTDVKDLCNLVEGGASSGDTIKIKASDGFSKWFDYEDVYTPEPAQGKLAITWYTTGNGEDGYVPDYASGMRLVFLAETVNAAGKHVFGNWDMHETLAESRWYYFYDGDYWPSSGGLSVKYVRYIEIYSSGRDAIASDSLVATANVTLDSLGIALDIDSIDFGNIRPGQNSPVITIGITNTGASNCSVILEIQSENATAVSFYEQSLYVNDSLYNTDDIIASILAGYTEGVDTQLKVPLTWNKPGEQRVTFVFWATASD
jgi:hypothetical protein